ncbi:MAG: cellulase family glycosylhydrolase [Pseudomonadota bacterium]
MNQNACFAGLFGIARQAVGQEALSMPEAIDGQPSLASNGQQLAAGWALQSPTILEPIVDRARLPGDPFAFRLHPDTFGDPDGDVPSLSASLSSGDVLPGWLTFDGTMFRGTAPAEFDGTLDIRVTACDGSSSVNDDFILAIGRDAPVLEFEVQRAINLGSALDAPDEGEWDYVIEEYHLLEVADTGFDTIRLPVRWSSNHNNGEIDPAFFTRVEEVIGWALDRNLNVVVNTHHFLSMNSDPVEKLPLLKQLSGQIATRFADMPSNVYFEVFNEPNGNFEGELVDQAMVEVLAVIRETNPTRAVLVGGDDWSPVTGTLRLELPNDDYIVPTLHFYHPFLFTHQGAPWVDDPPPFGRDWGSEADLARLADDFARLAAWREEQGDMPVFL